MKLQKIIIIGATSAIAQHCARQWVAEPCRMHLVGRNEQRLQAVADDLLVRSPQSQVTLETLDFLNADAIDRAVADFADGDPVDRALIAHGDLPDQGECQQSLGRCRAALELNGVSPALFAEALVAHMERAGRGQVGIIGSVAGDRGRKSNYIYGSAKALLDRYAQGLQHRLAGTAVRVNLIKPGPTSTPMTAHLMGSGPGLASVEDVARCIVRGMAKDKAVIYAPGKWAVIMLVIKHLPRFVFNRLDI
jgi:decaprenylphospho-beta-D-erythro-pentofuranosid-2-ulose 2-reductase